MQPVFTDDKSPVEWITNNMILRFLVSDQMENFNEVFQGLTSIAVVVLVPVFLLMTSIRVLISPNYPLVEYQMPGFPADPFGFHSEERLEFAQVSVEYLLNSEPISFLGNLKMADGSPLFNDRELSHMLDVKILVQGMLRAWWIILGGLLLIGFFAWRLRLVGYLFPQGNVGGLGNPRAGGISGAFHLPGF